MLPPNNKSPLTFLRSSIKRNFRWSRRFLILFASAMSLFGCAYFFLGSDEITTPVVNEPQAALTVTTAEVEEKMWASVVKASGVIHPWQEAIVGAQLDGSQLVEVKVDVGDNVKRGQVLARFNADMLLAEREQLLAALAEAQAFANQATVDHERAKQLKAGGGISAQSLLTAATQAETSAAQLAITQARLAANTLQLQYTDVRAPDDGVISSRSAKLGAISSVGQELFQMIRAGRLDWQGEFTAQQISQVTIGQQVILELADGSSASAQIRQIAPSMNPQSRLLTVYAELEPGSQARAGMFVNGTVMVEKKAARIVPAASVVIRDGRSYLFLLNENSLVVEQRLVQVGRREGDAVEIVSDLMTGEKIILQGAGFLSDGDLVKIAPALGLASVGGQGE